MGIIYLIKLREFIKTDENIYKVGRSGRDGIERIKEYPKDSKLYLLRNIINGLEKPIETHILREFKSNFIHRTDIGSEYFEGDPDKMIIHINKIIETNQELATEIVEYENTIKFICTINKFFRQKPENKNVIITDINSPTIQVFTENGWEEKSINYLLEDLIKNIAKQILSEPKLCDLGIASDFMLNLISNCGFTIMPIVYTSGIKMEESPQTQFIKSFM
jgi:hypothetical protein